MNEPIRETVLVTGASGGIGEALSRRCAAHGYDLVVVARSAETLSKMADALASRYAVTVTPIARDLAVDGAADRLFEEVTDAGIRVDALVNNAGFALYGPFPETDPAAEQEMLRLNMAALTRLTRLCLPAMIENGSGKILNVSSTAAFQPGPLMAVYYATKAYVLSFSQALAEELRDTGVTVSCLCPGPTRTGFQKRARMESARLLQLMPLMDADRVAEAGFLGMMKGTPVVVPGLGNRLLAESTRVAPRSLLPRIVRLLQASDA